MFHYEKIFMENKKRLYPVLLYKLTDNVDDVEEFAEINPILEDMDYDEILTRYLTSR